MAISGTGTGSTLTINISGAETFSSLATFLNSNPTYGTANPAYLEITANINFASGATLSRSGNIMNTIIFGTNSFNYRITSTVFDNTNLGIIYFGTDGVLILQAKGFQGSGQGQIHARIKATNFDLYINHTSSTVGTADLFYRSDNTIVSLDVSGKFRAVYNNTYSSTMGLLLSNSFPLGSLEFVVGASASSTRALFLNGTTNTIVAPISFFKKLGTEETEIFWGRNNGSGNWVFNEPAISGTSNLTVKTWNGGIAELRDLQYPSGWNKVIKLEHISGTWENLNKQLFVKNSITLPELDKIGYAIRVKDNTETQVSTKLTADGEFGTRYITWKSATNPNSGTIVTATTRTNTEVKVRKYDKKEIVINFTEFDRAYSYLLPAENQSYLTLTEAQAIALTGIAFAPSGATGGVVTISGARTVAELWQSYRAWISQTANFDSEDTWTYDGTNLNIGAWTISGIEFLTGGNITTSTATANGTISNLSIVGNVSQVTPTNLSNVQISGTLTYNTNTDTTITITDTNINTVENIGTGIITINKVNSTIDNYTDAEINFNDSTISVIGADTITFHPTANDRDLNVNASGSFSGSYAFKFGSTINGSTMSDTLYLRCVAGAIPFNIDKSIVLGDNLVDLGTTAQLASLSAKIDLTAKESTLLQTETDIIAEINANETKIDTLQTSVDNLPTLSEIEASTELAKESSVQLAIAVSV